MIRLTVVGVLALSSVYGAAYGATCDRACLKTTLDRVLPYWTGEIAPKLAAGETLLIAAHGNSLRAVVKHLFGVPDEAITAIEIPTGNPLLISLDAALKPLSARYLDEDRAERVPVAA